VHLTDAEAGRRIKNLAILGVAAERGQTARTSALEVLLLFVDVLPVVGVRRRRLALDDRLPQLGELGVERLELLLRGRDVVFGKMASPAFRDAKGAVDALVRVDDEEIGSFAKTVDRTYIDAVGVLAANAGFGDDVSHARARTTI
jgi:hypothetical protein